MPLPSRSQQLHLASFCPLNQPGPGGFPLSFPLLCPIWTPPCSAFKNVCRGAFLLSIPITALTFWFSLSQKTQAHPTVLFHICFLPAPSTLWSSSASSLHTSEHKLGNAPYTRMHTHAHTHTGGLLLPHSESTSSHWPEWPCPAPYSRGKKSYWSP